MIFQNPAKWLSWLYPKAIWNLPTNEKIVYLTFDDGPHPQITPWVMDLLSQHRATATFFCTGENVTRYPEVYEKIKAHHKAGNHTENHLNGFDCNHNEYAHNIELCREKVESNLFRPPYGRMKRSQYKNLLQSDFHIVMWSLLSWDYIPKLNLSRALKMLKKNTAPGSIVVFHDSEKANGNLKVLLPAYLEFLTKNGFSCKSISL